MRRRYVSTESPAASPGYDTAGRPIVEGPPVAQEVGAGQVVTEAGTRSRIVEHPSWSPAQIVAGLAGLVLTIIGAIALARTGTHFSNLSATHAQAAGLYFSALSAVVQLVAGVLLLGTAVFPESAKVGLALFGVLLLAWGIIVAADTSRLVGTWGYSSATGIFYAVMGAVMLLVAAVSPIFYSSRRRIASGEAQQIDRGYSRI